MGQRLAGPFAQFDRSWLMLLKGVHKYFFEKSQVTL
jgi:hypothetical protein